MRKYNEKFNKEDFKNLLKDVEKRATLPSKHREFTMYVDSDNYCMVRSGADQFDQAIRTYSGISNENYIRDEFIKRNKMSKDMEEEYRRCKDGFEDMTGEQYFFYNYCKINGEAPIRRDSDDAFFKDFENYKKNVGLKKVLWGRRRHYISDKDMRFQYPLTPEEAFYRRDELKTEEE